MALGLLIAHVGGDFELLFFGGLEILHNFSSFFVLNLTQDIAASETGGYQGQFNILVLVGIDDHTKDDVCRRINGFADLLGGVIYLE